MEHLSESAQDYLEAIYDLGAGGSAGGVRSVDVAQKLGVSRASVNKAINLLQDKGLLLHERYDKVHLTPEGVVAARDVRETHNLLSRFFSEILGVDPSIADADACKVEHDLSPDTLSRLKDFVRSCSDNAESSLAFSLRKKKK